MQEAKDIIHNGVPKLELCVVDITENKAQQGFNKSPQSDEDGYSCVTLLCSMWKEGNEFLFKVAKQKLLGSAAPVKGETVAKLQVAINSFGRIGRDFLSCWHGRKDSPLEVVVVNDSGGVKNASHLLKYDSMLGTFKADVKIVDNETISVDGKPIKVVSSRDPLKLPWVELGIGIVIEGTCAFVDGPGAGKHIQAGAKKVIITAPAKGDDITIYVVGVNEQHYSHEVANIVSNASCTTNCLAPFVKVLNEEFGIVKGTMTTTHSYTGDQRLLDASYRDLRRARAATLNIVPTSTGAAKAVSLVLPQLKGKLNGIALRVPTPNVQLLTSLSMSRREEFQLKMSMQRSINGYHTHLGCTILCTRANCDELEMIYCILVNLATIGGMPWFITEIEFPFGVEGDINPCGLWREIVPQTYNGVLLKLQLASFLVNGYTWIWDKCLREYVDAIHKADSIFDRQREKTSFRPLTHLWYSHWHWKFCGCSILPPISAYMTLRTRSISSGKDCYDRT